MQLEELMKEIGKYAIPVGIGLTLAIICTNILLNKLVLYMKKKARKTRK